MPNLLNLLPPELIPFITKHLPIQDLKNCCSLDDIWKAEAIREIRKRLIVDCTFVDKNTTVKALIDPKSQHGSISKTLAKKMDLYITRMYGSKYPAVIDLGIGATNAGKKVMRRGWIDREKVSVTLPNIFDDIVPPSYLGIDTANFVVVDKPEYDLVLGHVWYKKPPLYINRSKDIEEQELKKSQYRTRNDIWELPLSLHTFYELLFPKFIAMESDGEAIITKFSKHKRDFDGLNEYYDSEYSETESESSDYSDDEFSDSDLPPLVPDPLRITKSVENKELDYS
ncbi:9890_t:CDS:2 [Entrophospora sp. SA101]|nr:9890_t:CDS:2 [Entrophospora sp. SA101]